MCAQPTISSFQSPHNPPQIPLPFSNHIIQPSQSFFPKNISHKHKQTLTLMILVPDPPRTQSPYFQIPSKCKTNNPGIEPAMGGRQMRNATTTPDGSVLLFYWNKLRLFHGTNIQQFSPLWSLLFQDLPRINSKQHGWSPGMLVIARIEDRMIEINF